MRLLLIAHRYAPDVGGVAVSAQRTARALTRAGAQVEVLAWTRSLPGGKLETTTDEGTEKGADQRVVVHRLGWYGKEDLSLQYSLNVLEWLHQERRLDAVWGHFLSPAGFLATLFGKRFGVSSIVSARGNDVDRMLFPPGDFARLQWTVSNAGFVTTVSRDLRDKLQAVLPEPRSMDVLPNVVDSEVFRPLAERAPVGHQGSAELRQRLGLPEGEAVLGFCGELRQKKGLPWLLAGFAEVCQQRPAWLLVVGEVRARDRSALARFADEAPEAHARILVTGHLPSQGQIVEHLALCDLLVLPSLWEGQPNALLEAMAMELPVIASDAGGIVECMRHGETGVMLPRSELHRLGQVALELLAHPEQAKKLGQAARRHVREHAHPSQEVERLRRLLERLAGSRKAC